MNWHYYDYYDYYDYDHYDYDYHYYWEARGCRRAVDAPMKFSKFYWKKLLLKLDIDINMKKIGFVILLVLSLLKNIHGVEEKCQYCERSFKTLSKHI